VHVTRITNPYEFLSAILKKDGDLLEDISVDGK
jgi:hypothetical protein